MDYQARIVQLKDALALADAKIDALMGAMLDAGIPSDEVIGLVTTAQVNPNPEVTPADESPPIMLDQPCDVDEVSQDITIKLIDVREFREMGFLHEINRLILHPCGLAMSIAIDPATGAESLAGIWDCREDAEGVAYGEDYLQPQKALDVASIMEGRGHARAQELGYVIQPAGLGVKQLHMTVKDPVTHKVLGPNGSYDEGEETPR